MRSGHFELQCLFDTRELKQEVTVGLVTVLYQSLGSIADALGQVMKSIMVPGLALAAQYLQGTENPTKLWCTNLYAQLLSSLIEWFLI